MPENQDELYHWVWLANISHEILKTLKILANKTIPYPNRTVLKLEGDVRPKTIFFIFNIFIIYNKQLICYQF